jgi:ADP-heptose:LPS heptosyltransferase
VVHTGGGSRFKKWNVEQWIELCDFLGDKVMLVGTSSDFEKLTYITGQINEHIEIRITKSLQELLHVIYEAQIYVGLDSGPANIASMLGRPCVVLFGPGVVPLYQPISQGSIALHHQERFPCAPCSQQTCLNPEKTCTEDISVEEVLDAIKNAIKNAVKSED